MSRSSVGLTTCLARALGLSTLGLMAFFLPSLLDFLALCLLNLTSWLAINASICKAVEPEAVWVASLCRGRLGQGAENLLGGAGLLEKGSLVDLTNSLPPTGIFLDPLGLTGLQGDSGIGGGIGWIVTGSANGVRAVLE